MGELRENELKSKENIRSPQQRDFPLICETENMVLCFLRAGVSRLTRESKWKNNVEDNGRTMVVETAYQRAFEVLWRCALDFVDVKKVKWPDATTFFEIIY